MPFISPEAISVWWKRLRVQSLKGGNGAALISRALLSVSFSSPHDYESLSKLDSWVCQMHAALNILTVSQLATKITLQVNILQRAHVKHRMSVRMWRANALNRLGKHSHNI